MSATEILEQIRRLPAREQLEVAEQIWNELVTRKRTDPGTVTNQGGGTCLQHRALRPLIYASRLTQKEDPAGLTGLFHQRAETVN